MPGFWLHFFCPEIVVIDFCGILHHLSCVYDHPCVILSNRSLASLFSSSCSNLSIRQRPKTLDNSEQKPVRRMLKMKLLVRLVELGVLFSSFLLQAQNRLSPSTHPCFWSCCLSLW